MTHRGPHNVVAQNLVKLYANLETFIFHPPRAPVHHTALSPIPEWVALRHSFSPSPQNCLIFCSGGDKLCHVQAMSSNPHVHV